MPTSTPQGDPVHPGWPADVGILAIEIYFPSQFVDQAELEQHDGVSAGKYTIGLGQTRMGFCSDREDVNSLCLTAVSRLMEKTGTALTDIGRLEVGTETIVDKSKSVKSVLMQLFADSGNTDLEGIDCTNACYGGTSALFNSINWCESSACDGRLALAVCADIAVYAAGAARPSGGAGAVAMLVGPDAPLVIDRGVRSSYMEHVYDFYKPDMSSEYPVVDAKLSIQSYLNALDNCYGLYKNKCSKLDQSAGRITTSSFDAILFHTPYCKLVQKSVGRLALHDYISTTDPEERAAAYPGLDKFADTQLKTSYFDRDVEKAFMGHSAKIFETKTKPSLHLATNVGNMYTPSVYGGLVSYLLGQTEESLPGQKIGVFSYGSGLASSFYSISVAERARGSPGLSRLLACVADVQERLLGRTKVPPADFVACLGLREAAIHASPHDPAGATDGLFPGTWYLTRVDEQHRREYARTEIAAASSGTTTQNGNSQNGHV